LGLSGKALLLAAGATVATIISTQAERLAEGAQELGDNVVGSIRGLWDRLPGRLRGALVGGMIGAPVGIGTTGVETPDAPVAAPAVRPGNKEPTDEDKEEGIDGKSKPGR
jgi:hypothetical protein